MRSNAPQRVHSHPYRTAVRPGQEKQHSHTHTHPYTPRKSTEIESESSKRITFTHAKTRLLALCLSRSLCALRTLCSSICANYILHNTHAHTHITTVAVPQSAYPHSRRARAQSHKYHLIGYIKWRRWERDVAPRARMLYTAGPTICRVYIYVCNVYNSIV